WSVTVLKSNPPRQVRLKQIESLLNAFLTIDSKTSLFDNVQSFLSGNFIRQRETSDYAQTIKFIKDFVRSSNSHFDETKEIRIEELIFIFPKLVDYKGQLRSILTFNSGWLEASSIASQFSIHLTNSISKNLIDKYDNLDKSLELFINPKGLTFTEDELISRFNYPTENLNDIDF
ncbi:MAG: hypothetical protein CFE23_16730, partial [Flavobacterium sp. BFFFF1]|uniref:hypothetical protein n=1 Tax=Flavobacterium sp. BFFFF1 TaxID=2015557 RepID=UPI000BC79ADA